MQLAFALGIDVEDVGVNRNGDGFVLGLVEHLGEIQSRLQVLAEIRPHGRYQNIRV